MVAREGHPRKGAAPRVGCDSGRREDGLERLRLQALEQGLLDLVQPLLVLDHVEDACESRAFFTGQQEGGADVGAL